MLVAYNNKIEDESSTGIFKLSRRQDFSLCGEEGGKGGGGS